MMLDCQRRRMRQLIACMVAMALASSDAASFAEDFKVSEQAPGYRWLRMHADGRLETGVERLKDFAFTIDYGSNGY